MIIFYIVTHNYPSPLPSSPTLSPKVQPVIQSRIASYSSSEIRFNLMALVQSKLETWITRRDQIKLLLDTSTDSSITGTLYSEYAELVDKIMYEEERRAGWKKENQRRRANYMGFMYQLLVEMAKKGALVSKAQ